MYILDLIIVVLLFIYLYRNKRFSLINPLVIYLLIHLFFVTFRYIQIYLFHSKLISNINYQVNITIDDINKAVLLADIGLVSFFIGFIILKQKFIGRGEKLLKIYSKIIEQRKIILNIFLYSIFLLGLIGILFFNYIPGFEKNQFNKSIFSQLLANLGIIASLVIIYEKGFKIRFVILFIIMVLIFSIQGYARYRVVLSLFFILLYYLKIFNHRLPPINIIVLCFTVITLSFPLKEIGQKIRKGQSIDLINITTNSIENIFNGEAGDLALIEQSAAMINNTDIKNKIFYGRTYTPILFFFVPRDWWNEKPKLNAWQFEISTQGRNFGRMGQISLITGEAYANFRYFGVILISFLLGMFYSFLYFSYAHLNYKHKGFLLLLLFNMVLFQVWRDGLISIFLFPLLNYWPFLGLYFIKKHQKLLQYK